MQTEVQTPGSHCVFATEPPITTGNQIMTTSANIQPQTEVAIAYPSGDQSKTQAHLRNADDLLDSSRRMPARLLEEFRALGVATDEKTAYRRTKEFYRRSGGKFTHQLSD